jgi:flagellar export protein FliJ
MKQFVFTLQALYDVQDSIEKQTKMRLGALEAEIAQCAHELDVLNAHYDKAQGEYCRVMTGGVSAVRIRHYGAFFEKLRAVMLLQQSKIRKLETEKDKCLQKLIHVKREKMLLDKLREEQYSEYLSELKKQQANIMDDFISYRANVS